MIDTLPKTATGDLASQTRNMREKRRAAAVAKYQQLLARAANPLDGDTQQLDDVLQDVSLGLTMADFEADASAMKSISRLEAGLSAGNSAALESRKKQAEAVYDRALGELIVVPRAFHRTQRSVEHRFRLLFARFKCR